jgi:hypothetical protein
MYGVSTCFPPKYIKAKKLATKNQNNTFITGLNCSPRMFDWSKKGKAKRTMIAANIAITHAFW